jgi:hypothetical protein
MGKAGKKKLVFMYLPKQLNEILIGRDLFIHVYSSLLSLCNRSGYGRSTPHLF